MKKLINKIDDFLYRHFNYVSRRRVEKWRSEAEEIQSGLDETHKKRALMVFLSEEKY